MNLDNILRAKDSELTSIELIFKLQYRDGGYRVSEEVADLVNKLSDLDKVNLIMFIEEIYFLKMDRKAAISEVNRASHALIEYLTKRKVVYDISHVCTFIDKIIEFINIDVSLRPNYSYGFVCISKPIIKNVLRYFSSKNNINQLPDDVIEKLNILKEVLKSYRKIINGVNGVEKDFISIENSIDNMVFLQSAEGKQRKHLPTYFMGDDDFKDFANDIIQQQTEEEQQIWFQLIARAQKASGGKPTDKYLSETKALINTLAKDKFKKIVNEWLQFIINYKEKLVDKTSGRYTWQEWVFLSGTNMEIIKGFVWMMSHFYDAATLQNLAQLAERCFKKVPQRGPLAPGLGNACLFALFQSKGLDGMGHLSRLKLKIKQNNTQTLIQKYIEEAAEKLGVSTDQIEDMSVEDFDLIEGKRTYQLEDYTIVIEITAPGKSALTIMKADGSVLKTVPTIIKEKHAEKFKKIKNTQKQIDLNSIAQRDRIDRMLRYCHKMTWAYFNQYFLSHGLLSFLSKKIIWNVSNEAGQQHSVLLVNNEWLTNDAQKVNIEDFTSFSLWHPVTSSTDDVKKWRDFLMEHQIQQPLKQAFREVYILTDAEINTKTYSNRMAAHILKQHQFNVLAKSRGWKYSLLGSYDDGRDDEEIARLNLSEYGIEAQFWVSAVNERDAFNDAGIWDYVSTDQVRFMNTTTDSMMDLIDVPAIVLSEVLRDVDLFVGVASVGNDPQWQDTGGLPAHRDYWESYSFGNLSEVAKSRKQILTGLLPRLKIAKSVEIRDRFVIVKGKIRTYKIHIGSTNILMEPNDQYLCIVSNRSAKDLTERVFLPFEGDRGLSVILSKAFLLVDDDKITDSSITSQIRR